MKTSDYISKISRRRVIALGVIASGIGVLAGLAGTAYYRNDKKQEWNFKYRLTVVLDTPEGQKSESSIITVDVKNSNENGDFHKIGNSNLFYEFDGEAVPVDMGRRGTIFALLRDKKNEDFIVKLPIRAFSRAGKISGYEGGDIHPSQIDELVALKGSVDLDESELPLIVHFSDKTKPIAIEGVDLAHLDYVFGPRVNFVKVSLAMTDEAPKPKIVSVLPWLETVDDKPFKPRVKDSPSPVYESEIDARDFKRSEITKSMTSGAVAKNTMK